MNLEQKYITSLEVAEMLETEHWKLLRKLDGRETNGKHEKGIVEILADNQMGVSDYFAESTYTDASGKTNKCYNITKLGCDFLANKFTGEKGILFTAKYVKRFREMEETIKIPMTTAGQIQLLAQGHVELEQKINSIGEDLQKFKTEMPLLAVDTEKITKAVKAKGIEMMGGKTSNAYRNNSLRTKVYTDIHNQIKRNYGVVTYKALKRNECDEVLDFIGSYSLPKCLSDEITADNSQITIEF